MGADNERRHEVADAVAGQRLQAAGQGQVAERTARPQSAQGFQETRRDLRGVLAHNRDEEKEHAAMVLEWIRRRDPTFDKELRDYLFSDSTIAHD